MVFKVRIELTSFPSEGNILSIKLLEQERIRIWWWISKEKIIADYLEVIQNGFSSYNSKQDDLER